MGTQKTKNITLRCYAYPGRSDGVIGIYAVCIDLGLVTWRPSLKEAQSSLNDAIQGYVDTLNVLAQEGRETKDLIPRPAPFFPYLFYYYLLRVVTIIPRLRRAFRKSVFFKQSLELPIGLATA